LSSEKVIALKTSLAVPPELPNVTFPTIANTSLGERYRLKCNFRRKLH